MTQTRYRLTMTGYIEVKETLVQFRKSKKLSIRDFCNGLSVSPEDYAKYETGGKLPVYALIEIYKKYGHNLIARESKDGDRVIRDSNSSHKQFEL